MSSNHKDYTSKEVRFAYIKRITQGITIIDDESPNMKILLFDVGTFKLRF